ncbi:MAG: hypothetical protein WCK98_06270 [bacterium]
MPRILQNLKKHWKVLIIITLVVVSLSIAVMLELNSRWLKSVCNSTNADFGFGSQRQTLPYQDETRLTADLSVMQYQVGGQKQDPNRLEHTLLSIDKSLLSNCVSSPWSIATVLVFRDSQGNFIAINHNKNFSTQQHSPQKIDFFKQKRIYNLPQQATDKLAKLFSNYKLYKTDTAWIFQNDAPYNKQIGTAGYDHNDLVLGKFLSFDSGKTWMYLELGDYPQSIHFDNTNEMRDQIDPSVRYTINSKTDIKDLYKIIKQESLKGVSENTLSRYFILDAGLVGTRNDYYRLCDGRKEVPVPIFWYDIESIDGKNRKRIYANSRVNSSDNTDYYYTNILDSRDFDCSKTTLDWSMSEYFSEDDGSLALLRDKLGLELKR